MRTRVAGLAAASAASLAWGDIVPVQGTQTQRGTAAAFQQGGPNNSQQFAVSAPDPLASWPAPPQSITGSLQGNIARVDTKYVSSIEPTGVRLNTSAQASISGTGPFNIGGYVSHEQRFDLQFTIDTAGVYRLYARVDQPTQRHAPAQITFGRNGEPPIVSLNIATGPPTVQYGPVEISLPAGIYQVQASNSSDWGTIYAGAYYLATQMTFELTAACYGNCDGSTASPVLNAADFVCFASRFAAADPYANCDGSTAEPVLNVADFVCFTQRFAAGCP